MDTLPPPYRHPRRRRVAVSFRYESGHSATLATLATLFPRSFFSSREKLCGGGVASRSRYARIRARETLRLGWQGGGRWRVKRGDLRAQGCAGAHAYGGRGHGR